MKSVDARVVVEQEFHGETISFESGWIAKQAGGAVLVRQGDTVVLVTVCSADPRPGQSFFPMVVEYQEKAFAAGRIPGGYIKREGRAAEHEILTCRIIDRPIRPLFPEGYMDEVQIICNVMSADGEHNPDVLALCGASAALHISDLPFATPIAGVRVARVDGNFVINPSRSELDSSDLEIIVAATKEALVMVEGGAKVVPENEILDALYFGHEEIKKLIEMQEELRAKVGKEKVEFIPPETDAELPAKVQGMAFERVREATLLTGKHERKSAISAVKASVLEELGEDYVERASEVGEIFHGMLKEIVRKKVVNEGVRLDGRECATVRDIECEVGLLPRVHGSSLFTRGETQALVTTTLGTGMDAQRIETLEGQSEKNFMLHYNFPPYSVGEVKMLRGASRREVGHGALASRALTAVLPETDDFPYVLRVVSETTESNGSSSMACVCGGSMSLMQAGVPLKGAVAGVAMGLIKEEGKFVVLTDILGDEDHLGDMDFKVAGTNEGITAFQMDIKCDGLTREIMDRALGQAKEGRLHILGEMAKAIATPNENLSPYAPSITTFKINPDKIRDVIGPGGKTIRSITESTGVKIDISDDGTVSIASPDEAAAKRAIEIIEGLTEEAEIGKIYGGVVKRITDFGAFVEILPGVDGLVHISQLEHHRVAQVSDVLQEGDEVKVRVLDIDKQGRVRLSRKDLLPKEGEEE